MNCHDEDIKQREEIIVYFENFWAQQLAALKRFAEEKQKRVEEHVKNTPEQKKY